MLLNCRGILPESPKNATLNYSEELCCTLFHHEPHIPNRQRVLEEAHRILRDDGIAIATMLSPVLSAIWHRWAFWDRDQYERGLKSGEIFGLTKYEMEALFEAAGFDIVRKEPFSWGLNNVYIAKKQLRSAAKGKQLCWSRRHISKGQFV